MELMCSVGGSSEIQVFFCVRFPENSFRDADLHGGVWGVLLGTAPGEGWGERKQIKTLMCDAATTDASAYLSSGAGPKQLARW